MGGFFTPCGSPLFAWVGADDAGVDLKSVCDSLRASEVKEVAALVVQDKALQRILAVWPMVRREESLLVGAGLSLDELWSAVRFDEREAVEFSGLPTGIGIAAFRRAKGLGLIYPDGSIHSLAAAVLRKAIKDALNGGGK